MSASSTSILVLVEADGLFEGRRRVRVPVSGDLPSFQNALLFTLFESEGDLRPSSISAQDVAIQMYDFYSQQFQPLENVPKTLSNCRLRIDFCKPDYKNQVNSPQQQQQQEEAFLALPWKEFDVNLSDGSFQINGRPLRIQEVTNAGTGTGLNVWDGSIALTKYLEAHAKKYIADKSILELGAGTGLVGIAAAMMGAQRVIVTDLEYSIDNLKENIRINQEQLNRERDHGESFDSHRTLMEALILDWFKPEAFQFWQDSNGDSKSEIIDTILASDVVWIDSLVLPLVHTLLFICTRAVEKGRAPPLILMSYQCRSSLTEELLLRTLAEHSFEIHHVPKEKTKSERIQVFKILYHWS